MTERTVDPALQRFVAGEHQRLVGLLALYTGDRWTADELAQDAIVRLCQHWPRVQRMADPRAWLNRVAINLANSWFRRRAAERRAMARARPTSDAADPEHSTTVAVRSMVATLPRRQRMALVLRYYEGLSVAQAAAVMQCAEGTVKALTHRGIQALRVSDLVERPEEVPNGA